MLEGYFSCTSGVWQGTCFLRYFLGLLKIILVVCCWVWLLIISFNQWFLLRVPLLQHAFYMLMIFFCFVRVQLGTYLFYVILFSNMVGFLVECFYFGNGCLWLSDTHSFLKLVCGKAHSFLFLLVYLCFMVVLKRSIFDLLWTKLWVHFWLGVGGFSDLLCPKADMACLVNFVLTSMIVNVFKIYKWPKALLKELNLLCIILFGRVTRSVKVGGLGIKHLNVFHYTLLANFVPSF